MEPITRVRLLTHKYPITSQSARHKFNNNEHYYIKNNFTAAKTSREKNNFKK